MKRSVSVLPAILVLLFASSASAQDLEPPPATPAAPPEPLPITPPEESQDSGLGLEWVYITAGGGGAYTNMASFSQSNLNVQTSASSGGEFDVGAGVRLLFVTAGLRARDLQLSAFNLWELDGEAALHMRIWHIDPYFGARGGYVTVGGLSAGEVTNAASGSTPSNVAVHGFNVGPMFGIDFYFNSLVTLGAEVNAEFLILQRPPAPLPAGVTQADVAMLPPQEQALYQNSGSSLGLGVVGSARLGLHF